MKLVCGRNVDNIIDLYSVDQVVHYERQDRQGDRNAEEGREGQRQGGEAGGVRRV